MSFPCYADYKDSGIEWLGEVPGHWDVIRLGRFTKERCDGPFGSGLKSEHYVDDGVRVIRLQNIRENRFYDGDAVYVDRNYYDNEISGHDVIAGDILIAGLGDERNPVGRACVAPEGIAPAMVKADCFRFRIDAEAALPAFIAAQLTASAVAVAGVLSTGSTRSRIPLSVMTSRPVAIPPIAEQTAIVAFLNRETARIDGLIAEQERLIALVKEKRQAVISHAVTKGLNPAAPMKDSGIDWLGEVPEHWEVKNLKYMSGSADGIQMGPFGGMLVNVEDYDTGYRVYGQSNTISGDFSTVSRWLKEESFNKLIQYRLCPGDIILTRKGSLGHARLIGNEIFPGIIDSDTIRIRVNRDIAAPEYIANILCEAAYIENQIDSGKRGAILSGLNTSSIKNINIILPPIKEQFEIFYFSQSIMATLDALATDAERAIDLLREHRAALISAAVTGKIDVRGLVDMEAA